MREKKLRTTALNDVQIYYMMLTVMTALSVLFLSSLTVSLCDLCKTVFGGLELWVIYNSFQFVEDMSDQIQRNILTISNFPENVCLTACVGPTGSTSFGAQVRGLKTYLAQDLICPKSGTASTSSLITRLSNFKTCLSGLMKCPIL